MIRHFFLTATVLAFFIQVNANTSRALFIGIDIYKAPADIVASSTRSQWRNLGGCVNDAVAMKDLVIAMYGFSPQHITALLNADASRERIIAELKRLVNISVRGDVVFIYYAGHGSQMVNSLSIEKDKKDETIVPADAYKGVPDIRDKELAGYFNQLLDKGVLLTVIFDSCHSGSAGRGLLYEINGTRYLEENLYDAKDPSDPPKPEERGALILSAAQDFEFAKEIKDENNITHGAFTMALLKALQQNAPDVSIENIYSSIKAIMKYYGKTQEPVLAANEQRKNATLFGLPKGRVKSKLAIAASKIENNTVELMGGYAFGLATGVKLKSIDGKDTVAVIEMLGANRSLAKLVSAKRKTISPGTLFEIISWSSSTYPALKIYIPGGMSIRELTENIKTLQLVRSAKKTKLVNDITKEKAQRTFQYKDNSWWYDDVKGGKKAIGDMLNDLGSSAFTTTAAVIFPPPNNLAEEIKEQFKQFNNIEVVRSPEESLYSLVGSINEKNELSYAFVKTYFTVADSSESLPARTDFEPYDPAKPANNTAEKLVENAFRVAKIKDWLMLQPPAGQNKFPFSLRLQHYHSGKVPSANKVRLGDTLSFFIQKKAGETWNKKKRYVYLFSIDAKGAMKLIFPHAAKGNIENRFPLTNAINSAEEKTHLADILVRPPLGFDTYFMLSTEEAIGNLSAFQQPGVISRGPASASKNPLEAILFTGAKSRSKVSTPLTWSIDKLMIESIEQTK